MDIIGALILGLFLMFIGWISLSATLSNIKNVKGFIIYKLLQLVILDTITTVRYLFIILAGIIIFIWAINEAIFRLF
jgi:hypothetical protein